MCSNYPGNKLEPALQRQEDIIEHFLSSCAVFEGAQTYEENLHAEAEESTS